ncbi:uncharacterized protein LOC132752295 [Ruditapes philippinarum]|uniref:uncharacterized protein LOC132752295 n=1 Tax=Ruditapes philippinarum TaxID=129788 RepID=UPI00295AF270|nr:uncharacterized protein LOC132752295 [Ruditapes philippinarum]
MQQTVESWDSVFYLTASLIAATVVFYLIFGSGEQQHWSNPPANICLIQKIDPLARKPYGTYSVQKNTVDNKTETPVPGDSAINRPFNLYTVQGNIDSEDKNLGLGSAISNSNIDNTKKKSENEDNNDSDQRSHDVIPDMDKTRS